MGASDLRVTIDSAKLRCVLDPALALGHALGPRLALGLTKVFEIWLTRSFWQVLDSSEWFLHPARQAEGRDAVLDAFALGEWIALRDGTDAGSWLLRWVGDCLAESQLRGGGASDGIVERFERFAAGLDARQAVTGDDPPGWCRSFDPLRGSLDALALSATLEGSLILCSGAGGALPPPVRALAGLGLSAELVADDAGCLFSTERLVVRQALAAAGLAALAQPLGPLAVVHALALPGNEGGDDPADPWQHARAWWYQV